MTFLVFTDVNNKKTTLTQNKPNPLTHPTSQTNQNQELKDKELIYLGKEPFLIRLRYKDNEGPITDEQNPIHGNSEPADTGQVQTIIYRCLECGKELSVEEDICPNCGAYGRWDRIAK